MRNFDLVIIGSGPGGQKAAIQAAKLGRLVCVIEKMQFLGGVAINTGTIPSKALREAVLDITAPERGLVTLNAGVGGGVARRIDRKLALSSLIASCQRVIQAEIDVVASHFASNGVEYVNGVGALADAKTVVVTGPHSTEKIGATNILIATGTVPSRPAGVPFDGAKIMTSDEVFGLPSLPHTMMVVGGGVIGTEYASMLAELGVRVTLIEGRGRLLDFLDAEICEALQYHFRQKGMTLRLGEKVVSIKIVDPPSVGRAGAGQMVEATLESGKTLRADCLLYSIGRQGATADLNLEAAGLKADERGRIKVDGQYRTNVPNIYACGDVIGFPALASTSMEQGRLAACHMFGEPTQSVPELFPYGIFSIPEISMVGWTEDRLTAEGVPYEAGIAQYKEIARGQLLGDEIGMLKMLIHQETHAVLGVHVIGTGATELIHIGQAVMAFKGTAEYFVNTVFNYPTLAECYKVAALNGLNKLRSL